MIRAVISDLGSVLTTPIVGSSAGASARRRSCGRFELVVDSAFAGMRKPDPAIYELTVQRLGVLAEECLFIDDFEHNCEAARVAGMSAAVYRDAEQAASEIRAALAGGAP